MRSGGALTGLPGEWWSQWAGGARVLRGPGCAGGLVREVEAVVPKGRVVLLTGEHCMARKGPAAEVAGRLLDARAGVLHLTVPGEPRAGWLDEMRAGLRPFRPVAVVSIGGGSVLDAGKALAALLMEEGFARDFIEGVGGRQPSGRMLPWLAAPTTAGTGSEASTNAVICEKGQGGFKRSLRHERYRARVVFLDPELLRGLPPEWGLACALDALTQLLEALTSRRLPAEMEAALILGAAEGVRCLERFWRECPEPSAEAGQGMLDAAFLSGAGLTRAGLGTIHGLAGRAGVVSGVPHAVFCGKMFGPVWRATVEWFVGHPGMPGVGDAVRRMAEAAWAAGVADEETTGYEAARLLVERAATVAEAGLQRPLSDWGIRSWEVEEIVAAGSDRNSPAGLGPEGWRKALGEAGAG